MCTTSNTASFKHPFDLAKALRGAKLITRDGTRQIESIKLDDIKSTYPLAVKWAGELGTTDHTLDGKYYNDGTEHWRDLFMMIEITKLQEPKPFDIYAANRGDKVITREGKSVSNIRFRPLEINEGNYVLLATEAGRGENSYTIDGCITGTSIYPRNLMMA